PSMSSVIPQRSSSVCPRASRHSSHPGSHHVLPRARPIEYTGAYSGAVAPQGPPARLSDVRKGPAMVCVSPVVLTVLNLVFWVGILFNLPGTWLMVLVAAVLKW